MIDITGILYFSINYMHGLSPIHLGHDVNIKVTFVKLHFSLEISKLL